MADEVAFDYVFYHIALISIALVAFVYCCVGPAVGGARSKTFTKEFMSQYDVECRTETERSPSPRCSR